jgi:hypothetical protein
MTPTKVKAILGGRAVVHCVHDRVKREVTDPEYVAHLGRVAGNVYDPKMHKLHVCACCENLFVMLDDAPTLCSVCLGQPVHTLGGPLPAPRGVI